MAKKKEALTLEQKLENAIIADGEQPYKIPDNWVWTRLGEVALYKKGPFGSSLTKKMFVPKDKDTYKVYEQGNAIRKDKKYGSYYITKEKFNELTNFRIYANDIIVSCAGTIGEAFQILEPFEDGIINQALMRIKLYNQLSQKYYLFYFDECIQADITNKAKGTAIKNIPPFSVLKPLPFPLPPLAEQQRIVVRIESLFDKLEKARLLVQSALDSFEHRKSAVLHQAFTGELTKKWREENNISFDTWEEKKLGELCIFKNGYAFDSKKFTSSGIQVIRMGNLYNGALDLDRNPVFINKNNISNNVYLKSAIYKNDILLTLTGTKYKRDYGNAVLITNNLELLLNQRIVALRAVECDTNYLYYMLLTNSFRDIFFSNETGGVNQGNVSSKFVETIKIPTSSFPEQQEIVRILDSVFAQEEKAKELASVIDKIELIKKSILAKAFRGELGTNNPDDENATELLKKILEEESK